MASPAEIIMRIKAANASQKSRDRQYSTRMGVASFAGIPEGISRSIQQRERQKLLAQRGHQEQQMQKMGALYDEQHQRRSHAFAMQRLDKMSQPRTELERLEKRYLTKYIEDPNSVPEHIKTLFRFPQKSKPDFFSFIERVQKIHKGAADIAKTKAETDKLTAPPPFRETPKAMQEALYAEAWGAGYKSPEDVTDPKLQAMMRVNAVRAMRNPQEREKVSAKVGDARWLSGGDEDEARDIYRAWTTIEEGLGKSLLAPGAVTSAAGSIIKAASDAEKRFGEGPKPELLTGAQIWMGGVFNIGGEQIKKTDPELYKELSKIYGRK